MTQERAVLAGGCFWGMQDLIRKLPGVVATRVGYTGGEVPNATYRNHGTHAEGIEILFDPDAITYRQLLEFFFQVHDPTTLNRQGNDRGTSYRSAIYYGDKTQKAIALDTIADVEVSGLWPGKVITEVEPVGPFWEAEPDHQDYLERYPTVIPATTGGQTGCCLQRAASDPRASLSRIQVIGTRTEELLQKVQRQSVLRTLYRTETEKAVQRIHALHRRLKIGINL